MPVFADEFPAVGGKLALKNYFSHIVQTYLRTKEKVIPDNQ